MGWEKEERWLYGNVRALPEDPALNLGCKERLSPWRSCSRLPGQGEEGLCCRQAHLAGSSSGVRLLWDVTAGNSAPTPQQLSPLPLLKLNLIVWVRVDIKANLKPHGALELHWLRTNFGKAWGSLESGARKTTSKGPCDCSH